MPQSPRDPGKLRPCCVLSNLVENCRLYFNSPTLTGVAIGGILLACFVVLLLLVVPCYLKRRRRSVENTRADDTEQGHSRQSNVASNNHRAVS